MPYHPPRPRKSYFVNRTLLTMNWNKPIKFKIGDVDWEMPLSVLLLLIFLAVIMMAGGAWLGFRFGSGQL
jgi:hypothetical protein